MTIGPRFDCILESARKGDSQALEALYRELAPSVLGYLRGQGAAEPEDLTSQVFVALVSGIGGFQGDEQALRSWVFTIAHRRLLDERRRLARRREKVVELDALENAPGQRAAGDGEEDALERLATQRVLSVISKLSPDQRAVVLLRVLAGLSIADTAGVLGKQQGAIKALQRRAFCNLAREMSPEEVPW